jgi:DNA primase
MYRLTPDQIESWVARHFEYKRRKGGEELLICNPFDGDDGFKFNISTVPKISKKTGNQGYWVHDWRPTAQHHNGSFVKFVQKFKGLTFKEALRDICGEEIDLRAILTPRKPKDEPEEPEKIIELPPNAIPIDQDKWPKVHQMAVNYLASRGVSLADAKAHRLHYTPTSIVFPYIEYDMIVYWQSRTMVGKTFEFPDQRDTGQGKSYFLYGFDNAEPHGVVYIAEAIFCAMTMGPGGLASGGAQLSEGQRRKLRVLSPSEVILAPDNDEEGHKSLYTNWQLLRGSFNLGYVLPPDPFKDWNDVVKSYENKAAGVQYVRQYIHEHAKPLNTVTAMKFIKKRSNIDLDLKRLKAD